MLLLSLGSDLSRNHLGDSIPALWGSMKLVNMYVCLLIAIPLCCNGVEAFSCSMFLMMVESWHLQFRHGKPADRFNSKGTWKHQHTCKSVKILNAHLFIQYEFAKICIFQSLKTLILMFVELWSSISCQEPFLPRLGIFIT